MAPARCSRCGSRFDAAPKFCPECGTPLALAEQSDRSAQDMLRQFVHEQVADRIVATGGAIREERRLVTAVFADLSGFSSLASRLDPEELLDAVRPVVGGLADIVGRYGGYVDKFAGDALLAFFGAPVSREDDAERALHMSLAMHRELPRLCAGSPLALHIGVNSGHVIAHVGGSQVRLDYSLLGAAVVLAQRLESLAPEGQTYVGESTRRLVADRFHLQPLEALTVKGYAAPVPAFRLVGVAEPEARRDSWAPKQPLVGRVEEVAAADELLDALQKGGPELLVVAGEAGVGKSRLLAEIRVRAERAGVRWLQTTCTSYAEAIPYGPVSHLLRRQLEQAVPDETDEHRLQVLYEGSELAPHLPFLRRLLGVADVDDALLEPEARRRGLHAAALAWTGELATTAPLVLAVEDVHSSDPSTLALLADLLAGLGDARVALVVTGRPQAEGKLGDVLAAAPRVPRWLRLGPLAADSVSRLLSDRLQGPPPPELAALVAERAGGNPFFAQEIVTSLQSSGALVDEGSQWRMRADRAEDVVPPSIEGLLSSRIDQLPQDALALLDVAAVVGRRAPVELLRAVLGEAAVDASVRGLLDLGLLERSDHDRMLTFRHPLVQEVAYARLLRRQRRALHGQVAEAVRAVHGSAVEAQDLLARHLYLADAGRPAVEVLLQTGLRAKGLFANEEALLQLERAAELARRDAQDLLPDLLVELADVRELIGRYDDAAQVYQEVVREWGDLRGWVGLASTLRRRGRYAEALQVLEDASAAAPAGDLRLLDLERSWTLSISGRLPESVAAARRGLAEERPADRVTAQLLLQVARAATEEGRPEDAVPDLERALAALPASDVQGAASTLRLLGGAHEAAGRLEAASAALERGLALAERAGDVEEVGGCLINLGLVQLARGDLAQAELANLRAIEQFERIGHEAGRASGYTNLAEVLVEAGDVDRAHGFAQRALDLAQQIGHRIIAADATLRIATILAARGRHREAAQAAEDAALLAAETGLQGVARDAAALAVAQRARAADSPAEQA